MGASSSGPVPSRAALPAPSSTPAPQPASALNPASGPSQTVVGLDKIDIAKQVSEILPGLWLGNREAACNLALLRRLGIGACVNVTDQPTLHPDHLLHLHVPVQDSPTTDIAGHFDRVVPWVRKQLERPDPPKILVYCQRGVSRSCTVTLVLLLHLKGWTLYEAWRHVKARRPSVRPNPGFLRQLATYERQLRGESSVRVCKKGFERATNAPTEALASSRVI